MNTRPICTALLAACMLLAGCASVPGKTGDRAPTPAPVIPDDIVRGDKDSPYGVGGAPQLFPDMGPYRRSITTTSAEAERYFNQGLKWIYGFNHDEAVRSFTRATDLDPGCAMAWWGIAYAQGPNYNASRMNKARAEVAWSATQRALQELDNETPAERALITALGKRYDDPSRETKSKTIKADYAAAMAEVWAAHPNDADIGTLYADALMLKNPWRLHKADGTPAREETNTIIAVLEDVFAFSPDHPGANHLYIHAVEAGQDKQRGVPAADRLSDAVPMSGHLTHMPSHIYVQAGLWDRAVDQNLLAMEADRRYLTKSPAQYRQHGYIAHNAHMLAFAAMMAGREEDAMFGARGAWDIPQPLMDTMGRRYDRAMCAIYEVQKRFGRWDAILAEPAPPAQLRQTTATWRACRAVAFAAKKDFVNARGEHAAFRELLKARPNDTLLKINDHFIAGEIALHEEKWDDAIAKLEEAVKLEDTLRYSEPPRWLQPVRHTLGAVYLTAGRYADAERVYREDLERWPNNGWSLFGLAQALDKQGQTAEADLARAAYEEAWARADHPLNTTCECIPRL